MSSALFSIITPCYRGTATLRRAYESLAAQYGGAIQFEWILVDDFSDDNNQTVALIEELCRVAPFPTKTVFLKKNYYGSRSTSVGAAVATGEYVLILDQDDMIAKDALRIFKELIDKYSSVANVIGICGRCVDMQGRLIGTRMPRDEILANELEIRHVYKTRGEMWQCTRREIVQEYFSDFVPGDVNGYAWTRIARKFQYVYTDRIVRQYDTGNPLSVSNTRKLGNIDAKIKLLHYYLVNNQDYLERDRFSLVMYLQQYLRLTSHIGLSLNVAISKVAPQQRYWAFAIAPLARLRAALDRTLKRV
ncbi:MAG: glycosyltransferase family 2 protein [Sulfuritalea sp.]|nr:glycosyltransferase family 2 protein [Sulfuritalea sp.]